MEEDDELAARARITEKYAPSRGRDRLPLPAPEAVAAVVAALVIDADTRESLGRPVPTDDDIVDAARLMKSARAESDRRHDYAELTLLDEMRDRGRTWSQIGQDLGSDPSNARQWASIRRARLAERFPGVNTEPSTAVTPAEGVTTP